MTVRYTDTLSSNSLRSIAHGATIRARGVPLGRQYRWELEVDGEWVAQPDTDDEEYTVAPDIPADKVRICWSDKSPQPVVTYRRVAGPGEWRPGDIVEADLTNTPGLTAYQWQFARSRDEPAESDWTNSSAAGATTYRLTIPTNLLPPGAGGLQYWYRVTWTRYGDNETPPNFIGVIP